MLFDLHCHSTASDGKLAPAALIQRARDRGVGVLAITDHDSVAAYSELSDTITQGLRLIPGIELSAQWRGQTIHVVGLNIGLHTGAIEEAERIDKLLRSPQVARDLEKDDE